jgi:excisionase family DNA binding protein
MSLQELINRGEIIRPDELARGLKVAQGTVYAWVDRGLIPYLRLGKCIRFEPKDIKEWLMGRREVAEREAAERQAARKAPGLTT